jgi:hypothetical protein
MEAGNDGNWNEFLNKFVKIIYDDGGDFPKKKEGILISSNPTHLIIKLNGHTQAILLSKILRVED